MLIYKNTFENIKTLHCNFPVEDQYWANEESAIVVDGITRDPIGISDLNSCSFNEMLEKYPRPSGAELAAKEITKTFATAYGSLRDKIIKCNEKVKILNKQCIKKCDYLENDYYGAVLSCIKIEGTLLHYAFVCDCGIIIYDKLGNIKFQTKDEKELYSDFYINKIGISWNLPEARVIVRKNYRNNINNIQDGKCVSYGAITGEEAAINFIRSGTIKLLEGDILILYSDGFSNFLYDKEFIKHILHFQKGEFELYVNEKSENDYNKYGKEKTIIVYKI